MLGFDLEQWRVTQLRNAGLTSPTVAEYETRRKRIDEQYDLYKAKDAISNIKIIENNEKSEQN